MLFRAQLPFWGNSFLFMHTYSPSMPFLSCFLPLRFGIFGTLQYFGYTFHRLFFWSFLCLLFIVFRMFCVLCLSCLLCLLPYLRCSVFLFMRSRLNFRSKKNYQFLNILQLGWLRGPSDKLFKWGRKKDAHLLTYATYNFLYFCLSKFFALREFSPNGNDFTVMPFLLGICFFFVLCVRVLHWRRMFHGPFFCGAPPRR